jgi:hypothetical protein
MGHKLISEVISKYMPKVSIISWIKESFKFFEIEITSNEIPDINLIILSVLCKFVFIK